MVPFAGYYMPVQYEDQSIAESHVWTRTKASLFDVSHMYELQAVSFRFNVHTFAIGSSTSLREPVHQLSSLDLHRLHQGRWSLSTQLYPCFFTHLAES